MSKSYWTKQNNSGSIKIINTSEYDIPEIFFKDLLQDFVFSCNQFYKTLDEFPFVYGERQTTSILLPSISRISKVAFVEQPVSRKTAGKNSAGRIDYWILYKDTVILLELKQGWVSYNSTNLRKDVVKSWNSLISQLSSISKSECRELAGDYGKLFKVGLMILPSFISSIYPDKLKPISIEEIKARSTEINSLMTASLKTSPNIFFNWAVSQSLQKAQKYSTDYYEIYPLISGYSYVKYEPLI